MATVAELATSSPCSILNFSTAAIDATKIAGCDATVAPTLNQPLVEDDNKCWEVQYFGEPSDDVEDDNNNNDDKDEDDEKEDDKNKEKEDDEEEKEEEENENDKEEFDDDMEKEEEDDINDENKDDEPSGDDDDDGTCKDDPSFAFKKKSGMTCVKMNKKKCNMKSGGKRVFKSCPKTCGKCSSPDDNIIIGNNVEDDGTGGDEDEDESETEEPQTVVDGNDWIFYRLGEEFCGNYPDSVLCEDQSIWRDFLDIIFEDYCSSADETLIDDFICEGVPDVVKEIVCERKPDFFLC